MARKQAMGPQARAALRLVVGGPDPATAAALAPEPERPRPAPAPPDDDVERLPGVSAAAVPG